MGDDIATDTKLNRLPPMEKLREGKGRVNRQGPFPKKKEGTRGRGFAFDGDVEEEEGSPDSSEGRSTGKILDVVI
jgi:hypothetical protein